MPQRVLEYCKKTGQPVPENDGEILRCIYDSLAMKYRQSLIELGRETGVTYEQLNIFGGGIKDKLLCQLTADACEVPVIAGPTEATVMGNVKVALSALGELDVTEVSDYAEQTVYHPNNGNVWRDYDAVYKNIILII